MPFALIFIVVIWMIGGPMAWVVLIAIPVMLLAGLAVQPAMSRLIKESQEDGHHTHAILVETLNGLETIKALGAGALLRKRWQEAVAHQSQVGLKSRFLAQLATNVAALSQQAVQVAVVTVGALLMTEGQLGMGAIIACTILSGRAVAPMAQVTQLLTRINQTRASTSRARSSFATSASPTQARPSRRCRTCPSRSRRASAWPSSARSARARRPWPSSSSGCTSPIRARC